MVKSQEPSASSNKRVLLFFGLGLVVALCYIAYVILHIGFSNDDMIKGTRNGIPSNNQSTKVEQTIYLNEANTMVPIPDKFTIFDHPYSICQEINADCSDPSSRTIYRQNATLTMNHLQACESFLKWGLASGQVSYFEKLTYDATGLEVKHPLTSSTYSTLLASCAKAVGRQGAQVGYAPVLLGSFGANHDKITSSLTQANAMTWFIETVIGTNQ